MNQSIVRRLDEILADLPEADRRVIEQHITVEPWQARQLRLSRRDAAIRVVVASFYPGSEHAAAVALETDLRRHRPGSSKDPHRASLEQILELNQGRVIRCRQIENVIAGARTPFAIISAGNCKP
jgi:hypothetical protein